MEAGRLQAGGAGRPLWVLSAVSVELMQSAKPAFSHGNAAGSETNGRASCQSSIPEREGTSHLLAISNLPE